MANGPQQLGGKVLKCDSCSSFINEGADDWISIDTNEREIWRGCMDCFNKKWNHITATSNVKKEDLKELFYDLGFRGLSDKQTAIVSKWCETYGVE